MSIGTARFFEQVDLMQRQTWVRGQMCKLDEECTKLVQSLPYPPTAGSLQRWWVEKAREDTEYDRLLEEAVALDEALMTTHSTSLPSPESSSSYTSFSGLPSKLKAAGLEAEVTCTQKAAATAFQCLSQRSGNPLFSHVNDIVF